MLCVSFIRCYKLKDKFTTTLVPSKATAVFFNADKFSQNDNHEILRFASVCTKKELKLILQQYAFPNKSLIESLASTVDSIYIDNTDYYTWSYHSYHYNPITVENTCWQAKNNNNVLMFIKNDHVLNNTKCPIYKDTSLLPHVNSGSLVIDAAKYKELKFMGESDDKNDHILLMEIMANCNYEQSVLYLWLLFTNFYSRFYYTKTRDHVNFKSLLKFLNIQSSASLRRYSTFYINNLLRTLLEFEPNIHE